MATLKIEKDPSDSNGAMWKLTFYENNTPTSSGTFRVNDDEPVFVELLTKDNLTFNNESE